MKDFDMMFDAMLEEMMINEMLDFLNDGVKTTKDLLAELDEIEALQAAKETNFIDELDEFMAQEEQPKVEEFEIMVNEYQAQNKADATKNMGLIQTRANGFNTKKQNCTIEELVDFINNGQSIYCSVLNLVKGASVKDEQFAYQQVFGVDIDHTTMDLNQLLKALPYEPTVIYNTFSHTEEEPRYRVLFISNDKVTDANQAKQIRQHLINSIPGADESCINASRIFFAGSVIYTNKHAIFNPFNIATSDVEEKMDEYTPNHLISDTEPIIDVIKANLMSQEIQQLYGNRIVKNSYEINNLIYRIPLHMVLGLDVKVGQKFNCVLEEHADENGSAHIQITQKGGYYFYKCFGCDTTLYITDFIAINELLEMLNIRTLWFENNMNTINYNRNVIETVNNLKADRPLTYARIKSYRKLLNRLLDMAQEQLMHLGRTFTTDTIDQVIFTDMYSCIAKKIGRESKTVQNQLDILMLTGLVLKLTDKQLKEFNNTMLLRNQKNIKSIDKKFNTPYAFIVYKWDTIVLDYAEEILVYYKSTGATALGASQRQFKELGCDTRSKNHKSDNTVRLINMRQDLRNWYDRTLKRNGFIRKTAYLEYAKSHSIGERLASTFIPMLNKEFGLIRATVSEELVKQYKTLTKKDYRKCIFIPTKTKEIALAM